MLNHINHHQTHIINHEDLYRRCDLSKLDFETTKELKPAAERLGQSRAMEALQFGIGIRHEGYNMYVLGSKGLGKRRTVSKLLERESKVAAIPADWCYINNFEQHHKPLVLKLPAGMGKALQADMMRLVEDMLVAIPAALQSDEYNARAQAIDDAYKDNEEKEFISLGEKAEKNNIAMLRTPSGYTLGPMKDNKLLVPEEFDKLPEEEKQRIKKITDEIEQDLKKVIHKVPVWQKEYNEEIRKLNKDILESVILQYITALLAKYQPFPEITKFINTVSIDIIDHFEQFRKYAKEKAETAANHEVAQSIFTRYLVNVLVDNSETKGAPVIYEDNPTYVNLSGRIEHVAQLGTLSTNFTLIKAGALHRANGGYLVLDARKVLLTPFSWEGLKRALQCSEVRIESVEQLLSLVSTISLQPEPIPIDIKVILTGSRLLYYLLKAYDPEFGLIFKVAADFSEDIDRDDESTELYARMIATLLQENELLEVDKKGVARVIEYCARMAEDSEKISLHHGNLVDLLRESDYWAKQQQQNVINETNVQTAIDCRKKRLDQISQKMQEQVLRGNYLLDTEGEKVAQVNGLSIIQLGDYSFGKPSRITATARVGSGKVIDIEREVELGGSIHSKGVMILSSYLANRYSQKQPLALSASLVFEQSYGKIEGDSASAAELCALLSALGNIPLKQGLAITGSVNQHGEVQVIGGVNEKIEGFFDICHSRGLTGEQGVIIPKANSKHLMLDSTVREAVKKEQFTIYGVESIDEMMSLLTGLPAGEADEQDNFPATSLNGMIKQRVEEFAELRKQYIKTELDK
ncbi:MAG: AAA family ATPase [Gammaproteobacteria bacterium]|nr:AAA family ATPase [Gammaproteobacteria bacterium]